MKRLIFVKKFKKDLKRAKRRNKDLGALEAVIERLRSGQSLGIRHRRHRLKGKHKEFEECHIEPDWILIWRETEDAIQLARTGSHSDVFKR